MFFSAILEYLFLSAPYLMLGLVISGIIRTYVSSEKIAKLFGGKSFKSVIKAAVIGIPLPLCSCSVIPTAITLKKQGASNGSTSSFLIATPETGADSVLLTYSMMDLKMAIIRPIISFFTAITAGFLQNIFNSKEELKKEAIGLTPKEEPHANSCCHAEKMKKPSSFFLHLKEIYHNAFVELLDDFSSWLTFGLIAGAIISILIPDNFFLGLDAYLGRFYILLIGIPLYVCASASTPIAAALILKGMSPGMALLFLLVGPATNVTNLLVLKKYIGTRGVLINLFTIAIVSLLASFFIDYLYSIFAWHLPISFGGHEHLNEFGWITYSLSGLFVVLLVLSLKRKLQFYL